MGRTSGNTRRECASIGFSACALFALAEAIVLFAAFPYWYGDPIAAALGAARSALLYGAAGALLFLPLSLGLERALGRRSGEAPGRETIPVVAGGALGLLLFCLTGYWTRRLFLPPLGDPRTMAATAAIAAFSLGAAIALATLLRRKGREAAGRAARLSPLLPLLLAATLLVAGVLAAHRLPEPRPGLPNILLVTIDTLRDDHLPPYGYGRETAPTFTRLARHGVVFQNAVAAAPFTQPATASLLTGLYPHTHGVRNHPNLLEERHQTLAEALEAEGYATAAFSSQGLLVPAWGFGQGFRLFSRVGSPFRFDTTLLGCVLRKLGVRRPPRSWKARAVSDRAVTWLAENRRRPFFLWLHYLDPHFPYTPPDRYATLFTGGAPPPPLTDRRESDGRRRIFFLDLTADEVGRNIDLYDGEIRYTDDQIGRVVEKLDSLGILDETIIAITSDHGESLGEHGLYFAHTHFLYEPTMTVPLAITYPPRIPAGRSVDRLVRSIDLMPTLLDLAGIAIPDAIEGRSVAGLARRDEPVPPLVAYGENGRTVARNLEEKNPRWFVEGDAGRWSMARTDDYKLIRIPTEEGNRFELYDLRADLSERENLAAALPGVVDSLGASLLEWIGEGSAEATAKDEVDDETMRALRSLGYIQ